MQSYAYAAAANDHIGHTPGLSSSDTEIKKRSVVIAGHRTSVSLENIFWETLRKMAEVENLSVNQIVTRIDAERAGNLSSAIRTYVLKKLLRS